jgi:formiminotetrahydrofolate cyclodeaminase
MTAPEDDLQPSLHALVGELEETSTWPEAGGLAGLVTALVAELLASLARDATDTWDDAGGAIAQASALRQRSIRLGRENAEAYAAARTALVAVSEHGCGDALDDARLGTLLTRAAEVPLMICETATDATTLAAMVAERVAPAARANAACGAALGVGAVTAAAHLVEINLSMRPNDQRVTRARELVELAREASERALAASA